MPIKILYIHPGDVLDIRFVHDPDETLSKKSWEAQSYNRMQNMLLTIHNSTEVGYCDFSYKFRLDQPDGSIRRWLA